MNSFIGGLLDVIKKSRLSQREFDNDQRINDIARGIGHIGRYWISLCSDP